MSLGPQLNATLMNVYSCGGYWHMIKENKGHFTHKSEDPWPLQSKSSHWSKGWRPSKFTSHTKVKAWRPREDFMDENSTWSPTWRTLNKVSRSPKIFIKFHGDHDFFKYNSGMTYFQDRLRNIFHDRFQDRQAPPSNYLKLLEFETCYIKPNPPLFSTNKIYSGHAHMVHSHFTLCLRAHDYIKWLSQHPWYGLWMRVKGPHHYKVTTLGSCVKSPEINSDERLECHGLPIFC